ncbi:DUF3942 family protein [Domibacillus sp. DTU_2020_1001157_1_SI_ALB_TIR_016]|uniref:DUF3942 family protein n=1 Tax=Domibacillus sp. DTU_2020_1001157_1_SI_ALB_TIR_016 TaxID=3077789 RepID=UPI0028ED08CB|nr:DUF3942 family protein [Domibacillus sp. DTU_2020_1001157_1_SI_ALB_TIR_016]WNS79525.1 DUF3942 family protein [Domibacillus sp. DTU_2020_1001157_1_SI_ALB_TIR_016]
MIINFVSSEEQEIISFCRTYDYKTAEGVIRLNFQDIFARKVKEHLVEDPDKAVLKKEFKEVLFPYLSELNSKIGFEENRSYSFRMSPETGGKIRIRDAELHIKVKQNTNKIKILQHQKELYLDELIVKNGKLFSERHDEEFKIEHLEGYLEKTFAPVIF